MRQGLRPYRNGRSEASRGTWGVLAEILDERDEHDRAREIRERYQDRVVLRARLPMEDFALPEGSEEARIANEKLNSFSKAYLWAALRRAVGVDHARDDDGYSASEADDPHARPDFWGY